MSIESGVTPIEAIIFDCDGTLIDSETLAHEVLVEYLAEFGMRMSVQQATTAFKGRRTADCIADLLRMGIPLPSDFGEVFRERLRTQIEFRLRPIAGALEIVNAVDVPFCIASNSEREMIELGLAVTGLRPYFDQRIFSAHELGKWKPSPDLFLHAAAQLGVTPERCAVVEDSATGIQAGIAAGMQVFGLVADAAGFPESNFRRIAQLAELHSFLPVKRMNASAA